MNTGAQKSKTMEKLTNKQQAFKNSLIKRVHTVVSQIGISDDQYRAALSSFGYNSSKDMPINELLRFIDVISHTDPDGDAWRKRTIAAIGAWLRATNKDENLALIKGIACQAAGCKKFNSIPQSRLRDIYYEFTRKAKTAKAVQAITAADVDYLASWN